MNRKEPIHPKDGSFAGSAMMTTKYTADDLTHIIEQAESDLGDCVAKLVEFKLALMGGGIRPDLNEIIDDMLKVLFALDLGKGKQNANHGQK